MSIPAIFLIALAGLVVLVIALYNNLVRKKNMAQEGWSGIDVQLKRRADLIPNLIESVKGYMGHERSVLEKVTECRAQAEKAKTPEERGQAEGMLSGALGNLFAVAENYPDLKANQNFIELQRALSETEEQIQFARRYYNGAARDLNISIQSFPGNLIAAQFKFEPMAYFELDNPADKAVPKVEFR